METSKNYWVEQHLQGHQSVIIGEYNTQSEADLTAVHWMIARYGAQWDGNFAPQPGRPNEQWYEPKAA